MRNNDWPMAMHDFLIAKARTPFGWGDHDCATFPADLGIAMGCADFLEGLRGYTNEFEAAATLVAAGYGSLAALVADRLGPEIPTTLAERGDVALLIDTGRVGIYRYTLAIFDDAHIVAPGEFEMSRRKRSEAAAAFRLR